METPIEPAIGPMECSPGIGQIAAALATAQADMEQPQKTKTATVKTSKGTYTYRYCDIADILRAAKPLAKNGISILQFPSSRIEEYKYTDDNGREAAAWRVFVVVRTLILHSSGEWIANTTEAVADSMAPQAIGSTQTYLRRYGLQMLIGIAAEEDDDGNIGQGDQEGGARSIGQGNAAPPAHGGAPPGGGGNSGGGGGDTYDVTAEITDVKSQQLGSGKWRYSVQIKGSGWASTLQEGPFKMATRFKATGFNMICTLKKTDKGYLDLIAIREAPHPGALLAAANAAKAEGSGAQA